MNFFLYDSLILQQYFENRLRYLAAEKDKGENPYPYKFFPSMSVSQYIDKYTTLSNGDHVEDDQVSLSGMITRINIEIIQF